MRWGVGIRLGMGGFVVGMGLLEIMIGMVVVKLVVKLVVVKRERGSQLLNKMKMVMVMVDQQ